MIRRALLALVAIVALCNGNAPAFPYMGIIDASTSLPMAVCNSSAPIAVSSATTTKVITGITGTQIHVCAFAASLAGTSPTIVFEYGSGSNCGTGTTVLSGTIAASGFIASGDGVGTILIVPAGKDFCILSAGTGPSIQGYISYTQY